MPKTKPKKAAATKPKASAKKAAKPAAKKAAKSAAKKASKPAKKVAKAAKPVKAVKAVKSKPIPKEEIHANANGRPIGKGTKKPVKLTTFQLQQKERLRILRDTILESMEGVAKDTLRSRPDGNEASAFGMHQADAGSDAYDKDFALSLLSQEQDALYEVEEAIKRLEAGTYGICEMSGKPIPHLRLQALPFARLTVECQAEFERTTKYQRARTPVTSLFGLTDNEKEEESEEGEEPRSKSQPTDD